MTQVCVERDLQRKEALPTLLKIGARRIAEIIFQALSNNYIYISLNYTVFHGKTAFLSQVFIFQKPLFTFLHTRKQAVAP